MGIIDLSTFATPLAAGNNFIKASFAGFAGGGKTRTAVELAIGAYKTMNYKKPVLFIDNEKGSRFIIPKFREAGIQCLLKETVYLQDILTSFDLLNQGQIELLFIDSLTKVYYEFVNEYKKKNRKVFLTLQDWGKIMPEWQVRFSDRFVEVNGSCIFTGRGGHEYAMEVNEETNKKEFVKSGVKMKLAGETPFEPDLNIWMNQVQDVDASGKITVWREALIMKDRSGLIDGRVFKNPKYSDFKPVVEYLLNVEKGEVAGATDKNSLAPVENSSRADYMTGCDIELEKIKAVFDKYQISTSNQDKSLKVLITEKLFGTSSGTEVSKMKLEKLRDGRMELEEFFEKWDMLWSFEEKKSYIDKYTSLTIGDFGTEF